MNYKPLVNFLKLMHKSSKENQIFIDDIEIINNYPIKYKYKNITLLGNKVKIKVKDDEYSQRCV